MIALLLLAATASGCDATAVTQADLNRCAADHLARADAALNAQWRRTYTGLHGRAGKLLAAQRAWLVFRDAECVAETAASEGGTIHPMEVSACRTRLTLDRTRQLAAITKGR